MMFHILLVITFLYSSASFAQTVDSPSDTIENIEADSTEPTTEEDSTSTPKKGWTGSLMFSQKDIEYINEAIKSHKTGVSLEILMPTLFAPKKIVSIEEPNKEQQEIIDEGISDIDLYEPQIELVVEEPVDLSPLYLSSILFSSPQKWSIWINHKKLQPDTVTSDLPIEISDVNERYVTAIWYDAPLDKIPTQWLNKFSPIEGTDYLTNNDNIVVDSSSNNVSFVFGINQSFSLSSMTITEGRKNPVVTHTETISDNLQSIIDENSTSQQDNSLLNLNSDGLGNSNSISKQLSLDSLIEKVKKLQNILTK